jgi:hypothetical protein
LLVKRVEALLTNAPSFLASPHQYNVSVFEIREHDIHPRLV